MYSYNFIIITTNIQTLFSDSLPVCLMIIGTGSSSIVRSLFALQLVLIIVKKLTHYVRTSSYATWNFNCLYDAILCDVLIYNGDNANVQVLNLSIANMDGLQNENDMVWDTRFKTII